MFFLFVLKAFCEIFSFSEPNKQLKVSFSLDPDNINTGFFEPLSGSFLDFSVTIRNAAGSKIFYQNEKLETGIQTHFSFNNTEPEEVILEINSLKAEQGEEGKVSQLHWKFESTIDSFNQKSSKKYIYEPAIYALNHILKRLRSAYDLTKETYSQTGGLKTEQKQMLRIVTLLSVVSLVAFATVNFIHLAMMKSYLNKKKYL